MPVVSSVLRRPYTIIAALILVCLLGIGAALRMPVDIFPEINIPVVSVVGEGGEQNAPLARAVIGGLIFATFATLVFVPAMYYLFRKAPVLSSQPVNPEKGLSS